MAKQLTVNYSSQFWRGFPHNGRIVTFDRCLLCFCFGEEKQVKEARKKAEEIRKTNNERTNKRRNKGEKRRKTEYKNERTMSKEYIAEKRRKN